MKTQSLLTITLLFLVCLVTALPAQAQNNYSDNTVPDSSSPGLAGDDYDYGFYDQGSDFLDDVNYRGDPVDLTSGNWGRVDMTNGNWRIGDIDIADSLCGDPLVFTRTYNSKSPRIRSFGHGWAHNFDLHLITNDDGSITQVDEKGRAIFYRRKKNAYIAPPGLSSVLSKEPDGSFLLRRENDDLLYFSAQGRFTSMTDRNGNAIDLEYDEQGWLQRITYPDDCALTFTHTPTGKLATLRDPENRLVQYVYDSEEHLIEVINPEGQQLQYAYDDKHLLVSLLDDKNEAYQFTYSFDRKVTRIVLPNGSTRQFMYPTFLGLFPSTKTIFIDENGSKQTYHHKNRKITRTTDLGGN